MSLETDDAMEELIPLDHEARHLPMTSDQAAHLGRVRLAHTTLIDEKYRRGQRQHGGDLWRKPGMLAHAIQENVDQSVYLLTIDEQIRDLVSEWRAMRDPIAEGCAKALERLLEP